MISMISEKVKGNIRNIHVKKFKSLIFVFREEVTDVKRAFKIKAFNLLNTSPNRCLYAESLLIKSYALFGL